eukprot:6697120-Karenia_brevis.AAC.1
MWSFHANPSWHIDDHLDALNEFTRKAASKAFGSPNDAPRKPWISSATWEVVKQIAPMRRQIHALRVSTHGWKQAMCFYSWLSTLANLTG